jgi:5-methylcytosine-specific restriction endonuclease McrA
LKSPKKISGASGKGARIARKPVVEARAPGVCHHCGGFPPKELTMDHLVPVIRGGKSTKGNLVPSCKSCNSERKHRLPFEDQPA